MVEPPDDLELARLILACQRDEGVPFEQAWREMLRAIPPLTGKNAPRVDRDHCLAALAATREWWRAAYLGEPKPPAPYSTAAVIARWKAVGLRTHVAA